MIGALGGDGSAATSGQSSESSSDASNAAAVSSSDSAASSFDSSASSWAWSWASISASSKSLHASPPSSLKASCSLQPKVRSTHGVSSKESAEKSTSKVCGDSAAARLRRSPSSSRDGRTRRSPRATPPRKDPICGTSGTACSAMLASAVAAFAASPMPPLTPPSARRHVSSLPAPSPPRAAAARRATMPKPRSPPPSWEPSPKAPLAAPAAVRTSGSARRRRPSGIVVGSGGSSVGGRSVKAMSTLPALGRLGSAAISKDTAAPKECPTPKIGNRAICTWPRPSSSRKAASRRFSASAAATSRSRPAA
mmetsp:Transcript_6575/g.16266  ORF Transcript_6575/g.16266 Transcript_6575/m.16266 type:complete len:309 (+) Transcript_6575:231-1157(+)